MIYVIQSQIFLASDFIPEIFIKSPKLTYSLVKPSLVFLDLLATAL
jgi:hypothetical protein